MSQTNAIGKIQGKVVLKAAFPEMNILHMALKAGQEQTLEDIKNDPDVLFVEPNYILEKVSDEDVAGQIMSSLSVQEVYAQSSLTFTQNYSNVKMTQAWSIMKALNPAVAKPVVAIIDTGVDANHTVLKNSKSFWSNPKEIPANGVDDDLNGYIDDTYGWNFVNNSPVPSDDEGHGTHVAGIVVGTGLDIFSPNLDESKIAIMPLKFLDGSGAGTTANAIKAIYYAVNNGANVINNSWGGPDYSSSLLEALTYAYDHKVLIVSAAGNSAKNNDTSAMYPANYGVPSNISVAATSDSDKLASFSNYGGQSVNVASPGVYIYSTIPNNMFGSMSGTSMAAPFVAGMAALALREAPALSGYQLKNMIISSVNPIGTLTNKVTSGGRIDSYALISLARSNTQTVASQPEYKPVYTQERELASESASGSSKSGGGCGLVSSATSSGGVLKALGDNMSINSDGVLQHVLALLLVFSFPLALYMTLRLRSTSGGKSNRKYDRFKLNTDIKIKVGERELTAHMNTISIGGVGFSVDEMLEKGGSVSMKIKGPEGQEFEVQGMVVWSEADKSYGVQFQEAKKSIRDTILDWTKTLSRE